MENGTIRENEGNTEFCVVFTRDGVFGFYGLHTRQFSILGVLPTLKTLYKYLSVMHLRKRSELEGFEA